MTSPTHNIGQQEGPAPLLVGDVVRPLVGAFAGREGRVTAIDLDRDRLSVFFAHRRERTAGGGLREWTEREDYAFEQVHFRGRPASEAVLRPEQLPGAPDEGPGLLQAVLDQPRDDVARQAYADWLEEHNDPHAAYLRVQAALAKAVRERQDHEALVDRERRLRASLNAAWVSRVRRLTTEPYPFDVAALDPDLAGRARVSTRLHPRAGDVPEMGASKLGGLFLWPEDEPWPVKQGFATTDWHRQARLGVPIPEGATVPLVPVLQLRSRDFPCLPFPPGTDLMQLFWHPVATDQYGPEPFVFWRRAADVTRPRREPPGLTYHERGLVPVPCRVYPEDVVEYPDHIDLEYRAPAALAEQVKGWYRGRADASYYYGWGICHGSKVGGFGWVNQSDCEEVYRETEDGRPMELLLSLSHWEINHGHYRWCPLEDRNFCWRFAGYPPRLTGGLSYFGRGNYSVLIDRAATPWGVKAYTVWTS